MSETNIYKKLFEVKKAGIKLQRDTEAFNYKYATLSQIQEKLSIIFENEGLLILHYIKDNCVVTEIREGVSDTFVQSSIQMSEGTKPQDKGSEISYYRRYNLLSLLDLEVVDDDAKAAQDSNTKKEEKVIWFDEKIFEGFKKAKDKYTKETAVKECRKKYGVSKKWAIEIEKLY